MTTFLLKTEPGEYGYDDLVSEKRTTWSGVKNAAALLAIRSAARGDEAFIYHTGAEKRIVGLARIASDPYPDPEAGDPKLVVFDLTPLKQAKTPVTLAQLKADRRFDGFALVRQPRLSVMAVPPEINALLRRMTGL